MTKRKFTFGDYSRTSKYRIHSTRNDSSAESENNSVDEISSSSSDENDDSCTESDDDHSGNSSITRSEFFMNIFILLLNNFKTFVEYYEYAFIISPRGIAYIFTVFIYLTNGVVMIAHLIISTY